MIANLLPSTTPLVSEWFSLLMLGTVATGVVAFVKSRQCHVQDCHVRNRRWLPRRWSWQPHPDHGHPVCKHHHPDHPRGSDTHTKQTHEILADGRSRVEASTVDDDEGS